jgi:hypothetical protein
MPGRHYSDGDPGGAGLAAAFGSAAMGIGSVAMARVLGVGCTIAGNATRDTAILDEAVMKCAAQ